MLASWTAKSLAMSRLLSISKTDPCRLLLVSRKLQLADTLAGLNGRPMSFLSALNYPHALSLSHR
jgi:hypothetical protein